MLSEFGMWSRPTLVVVVLLLVTVFAADASTLTAGIYAAGRAHPIDGVQCSPHEYSAYHEHQYVALYKNGRHINLPSYVGFVGNCFFWLHVHDPSVAGGPNILHDEQPIRRRFTLGAFLDVWRYWGRQTGGDTSFLSTLTRTHPLHIFCNGKPWKRSYRSIPLARHAVIYLEVGLPVVSPKPHDFSGLHGYESPH